MIKAVIFDLDGVLLNNTQLIIEIFQEAAQRAGSKVPDGKEVIATLGLIGRDMVEILLGKKHVETLTQVWMQREKETKLMPGIREVLDGLKIKKAIATSSPRWFMENRLKDLISYFDVIITSELTEKHKPDPEPLLLACKKLQIEPEEAVYVGDRIIDFETAKNAGMDFIGILSGGTSKEEFKKVGVKKIINSLSELSNIVK
jgi:HAD superfamily hydrolase (TIGR01549 family)